MVKCVACGLLGIRAESGGAIVEVGEGGRKYGMQARGQYGGILCCAKQTTFLGPSSPDVVAALNKERECTAFAEWQTGFTPKEHSEMIAAETLLRAQKEREEWQYRRDETDRQWRQQQAEQQRAWQERQDDRQRQWHLDDLTVAKDSVQKAQGNIWAALIVGGLVLFGTLVVPFVSAWLTYHYPPPAAVDLPAATTPVSSHKPTTP